MDDFVKFIIAIVVIAVVAIGLAYLSNNFTNWDITTWFDFKTVSESRFLFSDNSVLFRK